MLNIGVHQGKGGLRAPCSLFGSRRFLSIDNLFLCYFLPEMLLLGHPRRCIPSGRPLPGTFSSNLFFPLSPAPLS